MNEHCQRCLGACCEVLRVETPTKNHYRWLEGRTVEAALGFVLVRCRCSRLAETGACAIHDSKPEFCKLMEVGEADCKTVVRLLRPALAKEWGW